MAGVQLGFNTQQYDFYTGIELLPAADYPVVIEDVVAEKAKDPASGLLKVTFAVAPGHPNAGRKLFYRLNIWNASEEAKATAHKQLKTLCFAVGITGQLNNTDELKGRQCIIGVTNDGNYNNVKVVKDMAGNEPGKAPVSQGMPGQGMPSFNQPPQGAPAGFTPPGAMPAGFNPNQQQQPPQGQPQYQQPPQQQQPPMQYQQPPQGGGNPFNQPPQQQQPPAGGAPWNGAPQQQPPQGQPQYQQPPQQQQYQPQAQAPANPGQGFVPATHQQQPPAGWPQ